MTRFTAIVLANAMLAIVAGTLARQFGPRRDKGPDPRLPDGGILEFAYPRGGFAVRLAVGLVVAGSGAILLAYGLHTLARGGWAACLPPVGFAVPLLCGGGWLIRGSFNLRGARINVDAAGMTQHRRGQATRLAWADVARLQGRPYLRRLDVHAKNGAVIEIDYATDNFPALARLIQGNAATNPLRAYPLVFGDPNHRARYCLFAALFGLAPAAAIVAAPRGGVGRALVWLALAGIMVAREAWNTKRIRCLEIDREVVRLRFLRGTRVFPLRALHTVAFEEYRGNRGAPRYRATLSIAGEDYWLTETNADPFVVVPSAQSLLPKDA